MTFSSSLILPGQWYSCIISRTCRGMLLICFPIFTLNSSTKCCTSKGISSFRSLWGRHSMGKHSSDKKDPLWRFLVHSTLWGFYWLQPAHGHSLWWFSSLPASQTPLPTAIHPKISMNSWIVYRESWGKCAIFYPNGILMTHSPIKAPLPDFNISEQRVQVAIILSFQDTLVGNIQH